MAPGAAGLPAAERDIPASAPVAEFIADLPPRALRIVKLGLRAIELLPFPWRFSRMGLEAREQYLAKLETSRFPPYRDLLLLAKTLAMFGYARDERVLTAVGYESRCSVREPTLGAGSSALPAGPAGPDGGLGDLSPQGDTEDCDVVIVGSGAGGAVAATRLAEAGLDVVVLEAGHYLNRHSYPSDPLEGLPMLYRDGGLTVAEGRPAIPIPVGRAVGGTTVINSGTCFRAPDPVLRGWGESAGIPWTGDLEDDFADAERMLEVEAPALEEIGRNGQLCAEGAKAIGASGGVIARNAGACVQCSSCPLGCRIDAKRAMHISYLPRAVAAGARIRAGVEAQRIIVEDGRAVGVTCRAEGRPQPFEVRARAVICAGGALGTPELLLRSRLGGEHVGRHLHVHPAAWIGGRYEQSVRGWEGIMQSYYVDEWASRGLILEATFTPLSFGAQWLPGVGAEHQRRIADFDHLASIGVHLSDRSEGRVGIGSGGGTRLTYRLSREEARTIHYGIARAAEIHFAAGATEVYPQVGPVSVIPRGKLAAFEALEVKPSELRLEAFHPMSSTRMGSDPSTTVARTDGAVRGVEGVYIADGGLLPSSIGVNPMITILAFASHVARSLAQRLQTPAPSGAQPGGSSESSGGGGSLANPLPSSRMPR